MTPYCNKLLPKLASAIGIKDNDYGRVAKMGIFNEDSGNIKNIFEKPEVNDDPRYYGRVALGGDNTKQSSFNQNIFDMKEDNVFDIDEEEKDGDK